MSLNEKNKAFKPKIVSRIPVAGTFKYVVGKNSEENGMTKKCKLTRQECMNSKTSKKITSRNSRGFMNRDSGKVPSDIFVWKTRKSQNTLENEEVTHPKKNGEEFEEERCNNTNEHNFSSKKESTFEASFVCDTKGYSEISGDDNIVVACENRQFIDHSSLESEKANLEKFSSGDEMVCLPTKDGRDEGIKTTEERSLQMSQEPGIGPEMARTDKGDLREQIEKLSSFIESSEELRERSEFLLNQQKQRLDEELREKENLKNKLCCLEELRRNLQRKFDEKVEECKSLRCSLKNTEAKLIDEKEKVKMVKRECSAEVTKNAEVEVVLQTVLQELGSANKLLKMSSEGTRLGWPWNKYGKASVDSEEDRKRERSQFEGKIKLLEMDKKKLRCQIDELKDRLVQHEHIAINLRENNETLEFRIAELEIQLSDMTANKL